MPAMYVFILTFGYTILRYHIFKGIPWSEFPLFIANKAIALSAISFIALSYTLGSLAKLDPTRFAPSLPLRKQFGLLGFGLAAVHSMMALLLFRPAYYPKFFTASGTITLTGGLSMLFGILAFFVFSIVAYASIPSVIKELEQDRWQSIQRLGYWGCALVLFHVTVMGFEGWIAPSRWPGGLLPISLVAAIVIMGMFLLKLITFIRH